MQAVIETPDFIRDAKRAGLTEDEREAVVEFLARHPSAGAEIPGTGGARKIRFAGRGKGKSGGYRVIIMSKRRKKWSSLSDDEKAARIFGWISLQVISWFIERVAFSAFRRYRTKSDSREELLRWANREGTYNDPAMPRPGETNAIAQPRKLKSLEERLNALTAEERLQWANREGKYADPSIEP